MYSAGRLRDQVALRGRGRLRQLPDEGVLQEALLKGKAGRRDTIASDLVELRVQIRSTNVGLKELLQFPDRRTITHKCRLEIVLHIKECLPR
jgi:hypothetical protein